MKTLTFINDAGDRVILDDPTASSAAYKNAGYHEATSEELGSGSLTNEQVTAAAQTAAHVMTQPPVHDVDGVSDNVRSKNPNDAPADATGPAYPAGQIPEEKKAGGPTMEEDMPSTEKTADNSSSSNPDPNAPNGPTPLTQSFSTPPNKDEVLAKQAELRQDEDREFDKRGVHEHTPGEETTGPISETSAGGPTVPMPADLKPSAVVKETQGGTRPSASVRSKNDK